MLERPPISSDTLISCLYQQQCPPDAKGVRDSGLERYNRPVLPGKCVASFSGINTLRILVNLLSFFHSYEGRLILAGQLCLAREVQLKYSIAVPKNGKTVNGFLIYCISVLLSILFTLSSEVHFVLHSLKNLKMGGCAIS